MTSFYDSKKRAALKGEYDAICLECDASPMLKVASASRGNFLVDRPCFTSEYDVSVFAAMTSAND